MTMSDTGGTLSVGGVSFAIGVDLAQFEKNLQRAEQLAQEHAARIQRILGNINAGTTGAGVSHSSNVGGASNPLTVPNLGLPKVVDVSQTVNVRRDFRVTDSSGGRVIGGPTSALQLTGGAAPRNATPEELALILAGGSRGGPQRTLSQVQIDALTTRPAAGTGRTGVSSYQSWIRSMRAQQREGEIEANTQGRAFTPLNNASRQNATFGPTPVSPAALIRDEERQAQTLAREQARWGPHPLSPAQLLRNQQQQATDLAREQARMGPQQVSGAQLNRAAEQQQRAERAQIGPFPYNSVAARNDAARIYGYGGTGRGASGVATSTGGGGNRVGGLAGLIFGNSPESAERSAIRFGAALVGIPIGINLAAGAAHLLHDALAGAVNSAVQLEQSGRAIAVAYGASGGAFTGAGASAFAANPLTKGTTTEYQQTIAALAPLAAQYKLTTDQVRQFGTASGELARINGVELPQAGQVLQQVLRGNLEAGQALDLQLTNEYGIIKGVGFTWEQLVQSQGPAAARATLLAAVLADTSRQTANSAKSADDAVQSYDRLGKAFDTFKTAADNAAKGPVGAFAKGATGALDVGTGLLQNPGQALPAAAAITAGPVGIAAIVTAVTAELALRTATNAAKNIPPAPNVPTVPQEGIHVQPPTADVIARMTTTQPLTRGVNPNDSSPPRLPSGYAGQVADDARLEEQARLARAYKPTDMLEPVGLAQQQTRANDAAMVGQRDAQRTKLLDDQRNATNQMAYAQAQVDVLNAQADQRKLASAKEINEIARDRIAIQDRLAPMLIQEQSYQDQIKIITRENLNLTQQKLQADLASIAPNQQLAQYGYQRQLAQQRITLGIAQGATNQKSTVDIGAEINKIIKLVPALNPEVAQNQIDVTQTAMDTSRTSAAVATDTVTKALQSIPIQQKLQGLQLGAGGINATQLDLAVSSAANDQIERRIALQTLDITNQDKLIKAEQDLAAARQAGAEIASKQALNVLNGREPISVSITVGTLTTGAGGQDALDQLRAAAEAGVLDAMAKSAGLNPPRIDADTAAAR